MKKKKFDPINFIPNQSKYQRFLMNLLKKNWKDLQRMKFKGSYY